MNPTVDSITRFFSFNASAVSQLSGNCVHPCLIPWHLKTSIVGPSSNSDVLSGRLALLSSSKTLNPASLIFLSQTSLCSASVSISGKTSSILALEFSPGGSARTGDARGWVACQGGRYVGISVDDSFRDDKLNESVDSEGGCILAGRGRSCGSNLVSKAG